jgi:protein transport protein HofC
MVASVEAFEAMCPPRYRDVVRDFLTCLKSGATLSQAARTVPRALPDESTSLVIFGQSEGVLAPALQQAVASRHNRRLLPTPNPASVGYPIVISLALLSATSYFLIYVGPRIVTISNEFGAVLPTPSQWLLTKLQPWGAGINNVKGEEFLVGLFAVVCVAALVGVTGWALWTHGLLTPTPGLWLERRRETAALLRGLSVALEAERPETGAVLQLIRSDISRWSLTRWSATFDLLRRGQPLPAALRSVGLIGRSHVAILESAQRAGNLPWAMRVVADGIERRAAYRVNALGHVMRLFGTILLGGLVAVVALAYFCPLVTLIMHAVESI